MKTQFVIIIAFILMGLTACDKNDQVSNDSSSIKNRTLTTKINDNSTNTTPGNSANVYDSVGYWHNAILSGIQPCIPASGATSETISGCVIQFANKAHLSLPELPLTTVPQLIKENQNNFFAVINRLPFSNRVKFLVDSLFKVVDENASPDTAGYNSIKASIIGFENNILKDNSLSDIDKRQLLGAASVARYSVYYWLETPSGHASKLKNVLAWLGFVAGDVTGFCVTQNVVYAADCSSAMYWLISVYMN